MAATLAQDTTLATDAAFQARVQAAMLRRLMTLLAAGGLTSDQLALARGMIYAPSTYTPIIAYGAVTDAAIAARNGVQTDVLDAEIIAAVNAILVRYVR